MDAPVKKKAMSRVSLSFKKKVKYPVFPLVRFALLHASISNFNFPSFFSSYNFAYGSDYLLPYVDFIANAAVMIVFLIFFVLYL